MSFMYLSCPQCGAEVKEYRNPLPTVDIIIEAGNGVVLIERRQEPYGWALPGGFVGYGETAEHAAIREAREETSLEINCLHLLGCYSDPARDPRHHTISIVYVAKGIGTLVAGDDAFNAAIFAMTDLPLSLCFDHGKILSDYWRQKARSLI